MKISSAKNVLSVLVLLCFFASLCGDTTIDHAKSGKVIPRKKSLIALLYTTNISIFSTDLGRKGLCRWLRGYKHQRKLCQRKRELPAILQETRKWTLNSCRKLFEYDHWNCSSSSTRRFFKKMYRETAFMYSLATSALMYVVAKACAEGKVKNCNCIKPTNTHNGTDWQWGGCEYNTKFATKFTKKFLQLKKKGDSLSNVIRYNSEVGIKVVLKHEKTLCKCHGLSGSCSFKICLKRLEPFEKIAHNLKQLYHRAVQIEPQNNLHELEGHRRKRSLVYLDNSPNFCDPEGSNGLSTVGRRCRDIDNCATLCCSRDYEEVQHTVLELCHCRWSNETVCKLHCDQCPREETRFYCK